MQVVRAILLTLATVAAAVPSLADRLVVVELFTSQGCSSCPPADALLGELASRDDVLPLALHVDYWDYIGWKDIFADPSNTTRQKDYARAAGARSVYTPQMVVGGRDHVVGYKPMKLAMLIDKHGEAPASITATARKSGARIEVTLNGTAPGAGNVDVILVRYLPARTVEIRRGENAGHTLTYHNIVAEMRRIGRWNGRGTFTGTADAKGEGRFAVLVQRDEAGPILAAARAD